MVHFSLAKEAGKKVIAVLSSPMDFQPLTSDISIVDLTKNEPGAIEGLLEKVEDALGPKYTVYETNRPQLSDQGNELANSDRWKQRSSFWQMQFLTALVVGCSAMIYGAAAYKNAASGRSDRQPEYAAAHFSGKK